MSHYSVAQTKQGRIVVYERDNADSIGRIEIHESFEEFRDALLDDKYARYARNVVSMAANSLGMWEEETLDI
jgi:hypothetical protein